MGAKSVIPSSASFHQPRVSLKKNTSDNLPVVILGDSLTPSSSPPTVLVEPPYLWNLWDDSPPKRRNLKTSLSKKKQEIRSNELSKKTPSQQTNVTLNQKTRPTQRWGSWIPTPRYFHCGGVLGAGTAGAPPGVNGAAAGSGTWDSDGSVEKTQRG